MKLRSGLLLLLLSTPAAAERSGALRLWLGSGYDSNARRDFVKEDGSGEVKAEPDLVFSLLGTAEGRYQGRGAHAGGSYDLGIRRFIRLPSEDVLIQSGSLEGLFALSRSLGVGLAGRAKDRRGGDRDYSDLVGEGSLELVPDSSLELRLKGGAHRFLYWNRIDYSFTATELGLYGRYRFDRRHAAFLFGGLGFRRYQAPTHPNPEDPSPGPPSSRRDSVLSGGGGYSFRGPLLLTLAYGYTEQRSNSFGESSLRHRLTATLGWRLPWQLTVLGQGALQLSRYPDGVYLSSELRVAEDDESHNSLSLKLVRSLTEHVEAELKYGLYQDRLATNGLGYLRQLGWAGLSWRL